VGAVVTTVLDSCTANIGLVIVNTSGQWWNTSTGAFEAYDVLNIANYAVAGAEEGSTGVYKFTSPSAITLGRYSVGTVCQAGASLALTDLPPDAWEKVDWDGTNLIGSDAVLFNTLQAVYWIEGDFYKDDINSRDEYTVQWYKNDAPLTSGCTTPLIQVVKRADWTDLVAEVAMTQNGATGMCKYDASGAQRMTNGEAAYAYCTITVDGAARTRRMVIGRDS
jgi:hypothetical protein